MIVKTTNKKKDFVDIKCSHKIGYISMLKYSLKATFSITQYNRHVQVIWFQKKTHCCCT